MKNSKKGTQIGCIISAIAVVISVISMIISTFQGTQIAIFCCMIAVFFSNLAMNSAQKKKDKDSE